MTSKQLCKHDWVGDDNCAYCALEEANESLAKYVAWAESCEPAPDSIRASFKNFHRVLCERFGYVHDSKDWERDQLSLIEHIAKGSVHETSCVECDRLRTVLKTLLTEVNQAEGDYGIGLAMTKAEKAIGWSVMDQSPPKTSAERT